MIFINNLHTSSNKSDIKRATSSKSHQFHVRDQINVMSSQQTQSYSTFSSSSYSSSTDSSGNTYTESTVSNPSGTTIHRTSQVAGQPAKSETTRVPAAGTQQVDGLDDSRRIEEVSSEAD